MTAATLLAVGQSSAAGIITAIATALIAVGGVITALGVAVPLLRTSRRNTEQLEVHSASLGVIKTLVDGTLTAALQAQLDATRSQLTLMLELTHEQTEPGEDPSPDRKAALGALQRRVNELAAAMADREAQVRAADIQIATEAARASRS